MDPQSPHHLSAGEDDAGGGPPRRRSVGALLKLKSKKKEQSRDSDSTTAASETSLDVVPKKKTGFLRKSSKKVKEADSPDAAPAKKPSKAKSLVRKLSMSRNRKSKEPPPTDPDTSDDDGHTSSSTAAFESAVEGYVTPAATPPPPPLTPPPMEEDEDQSDGGPAGAGGAGGGGAGPRAASVAEPPVSTVTLPALEAVPTLDPDDAMKGEKQPQRAAAHGGAVKKTPKGKASTSQGLVDEERKQSTRGQLLSITTPALQKQQKQLNGQAAAAAAAPPATPATGATPTGSDSPPPTTGGASAPADVVHVVAEVGGLTPNGSGVLDSPQDKATNGAATAAMNSSPPPTPPSPSSGDLMADARNKLSQSLGVHDSAQMSGEKREHLYKILVIGELGTGKTSIIKRYVHQFFSQHYRATIGVDFALKVLNWDPATIIRLQLWDIAGQERFGNMTRVYYKEAVGAFIVFDVTRASTFDAVVKWKQDLDSKVQMADGSPIPCVLLANKCDQQKEGMVNNPSKMDEYCKEKGFTGWFETSAKENVNIEEAARALVSKILLNDKLLHGNDTKDPTKIALDNNGKASGEATSGKSCAC